MSYQVLARKWRPRNFSELAGQEHVQRALINALESERLHHAFLFTGTRGVGKTTIARILAKSLNCEKGITATPCGECSACTEISEGRFIDLIEVDAASKTKVEDTRDLLENVHYAPSRGRFKVYLIDEVHMLSEKSFNALLKTLEEPPPHVKFLLATTDPQKLPVTILSRCLQFNLKRLPLDLIATHLEKILRQENLKFDSDAIRLIADAADGSMRDALSLLDQAIAYGAGELKEPEVRTMLGTVDRSQVFALLQALGERDAKSLFESIAQLAVHSADFTLVFNELLSLLHRVALCQIAPDALDSQHPEQPQIAHIASLLTAEDTQLYYQIGLAGKRDLSLAPNPQLGFEMAMLRMLAFQPGMVKTAQPAPATGGTQSRIPGQPAASIAKPQAQTPHAKSQHLETISKTLGQTAVKKKLSSKDNDNSTELVNPQLNTNTKFSAESNQSETTVPLPENNAGWEILVNKLALNGVALQLAKNSAFVSCSGDNLALALSAAHRQFSNTQREEALQKAINERTGKTLRLSVTIQEQVNDTPALREQQRARERQASAENAIYNDSIVKAIVETFDGRISPKSIQPID
ncbi:MAG TPA: DNA polymerase III subunit gamma/tau [Gammaproteobacteria bacterium]